MSLIKMLPLLLWKFIILGVSVDLLKKRWRQLRDDFTRAKKKQKVYIPSGSGADALPPKSTFKYFELMRFLDDLDYSR